MKDVSYRVLRFSFCCLVIAVNAVEAEACLCDDLCTRQVDVQKNAETGINFFVLKAPRFDEEGNPIVPSAVILSDQLSQSDLNSINQKIGAPVYGDSTLFSGINATKGLVQQGTVSTLDAIQLLHIDFDACCFTSNSKLDLLMAEESSVEGKIDAMTESVSDLYLLDLTTASKLDECCFTMNSKLDVVIENTQSIIDNLNVFIDVATLESKLDECCSTMNGKLDMLLVDDVTVESKLDVVIENTQSIIDNLNVVIDVATLESKLDECCSTMNGKLDTLLVDDVTVESKLDVVIENTQSIIDNLNVVVDVTALESKLDVCCSTMNSKLDVLAADDATIESKIDLLSEGSPCESRALKASDVVAEKIVIAVSGNYCMAEDFRATVSIVADNVCLCMNNRQLTGRIEVYGALANIQNGTVLVPGDFSPAQTAGVTVAPAAVRVTLSQVKVLCEGAVFRTALEVFSNNATVVDSLFEACGGGDGIALSAAQAMVNGSIASAQTQNGGHGIACYFPASGVHIRSCQVDGLDETFTPGLGSGVFIAFGCANIEIRDCTLVRAAYFAIEDNHVGQLDVSNYSSIIYNNFAYDGAIDGAAYQIRNKRSMGQSYGVDLISGSPGTFANVYIS